MTIAPSMITEPKGKKRSSVRHTRAIRHAPLPPDDELPELTAKQRERIAAFALREDR